MRNYNFDWDAFGRRVLAEVNRRGTLRSAEKETKIHFSTLGHITKERRPSADHFARLLHWMGYKLPKL